MKVIAYLYQEECTHEEYSSRGPQRKGVDGGQQRLGEVVRSLKISTSEAFQSPFLTISYPWIVQVRELIQLPNMSSAYEVFFGSQNRVVTLKLIRYSMLMVLIPLGVFYGLFVGVFHRDKASLGVCGIAAVIATNLVIASYVRMAWREDSQSDPPSKAKSD